MTMYAKSAPEQLFDPRSIEALKALEVQAENAVYVGAHDIPGPLQTPEYALAIAAQYLNQQSNLLHGWPVNGGAIEQLADAERERVAILNRRHKEIDTPFMNTTAFMGTTALTTALEQRLPDPDLRYAQLQKVLILGSNGYYRLHIFDDTKLPSMPSFCELTVNGEEEHRFVQPGYGRYRWAPDEGNLFADVTSNLERAAHRDDTSEVLDRHQSLQFVRTIMAGLKEQMNSRPGGKDFGTTASTY